MKLIALSYPENRSRHLLLKLLLLALTCASCASSERSSKLDREQRSVPWNIDSMYRDVRWLFHKELYVPMQVDMDVKILAWRTTLGRTFGDTTVRVWTALTRVWYKGMYRIDNVPADVEDWAFVLISRSVSDTVGEYVEGDPRSWRRWHPHGPFVMYYVRDRRLTIADLDSFFSYTPTPIFRGCIQDPSGDSVEVVPILEGHIMTATWEEVFGEPPTYRFDLAPPRKEDE